MLDGLEFVKQGPADRWLMSDVFGLRQARSRPAEEAIEAAIQIQKEEVASEPHVRDIDSQLRRYLAQDDEFWPRWRFFAKRNGVA